MSKLVYFVDVFCHLNKLNTRVLHKYLCIEKQDRNISKEADTLGYLRADGRYRDVFDLK